VVGDPRYGSSRPKGEHVPLALHAARLRFRHPRTGRAMEFESPGDARFRPTTRRRRS
jgi:23S rRNA-/tRNA-specific pseudouridylate synthase